MIFTDLFENTDQPSRVKFRGTDHDIGEERYRFVINGDTIFFNFPSDEDRPDPDSPSFEEILAKVQRSGEVRHYRITPEEQLLIAKKIAAERQKYLDQRRQGVEEGTDVTDYNPKSKGGTRKELIARYHKTKNPKDAEAARKAGATQKELQGVAEAMKPSDIPPSMRDRLTMRDIEAERPEGAFRFRVVTPQGDAIDFMDQAAAEQRARAMGGRVEPIDPQPQGIPGRNRFRVQDPQGSRPAATFQDRAAAERYASAKKLPVEIIPEERNKPGARIERILKMLRARHPQAENDLEALIFDFRGQQAQDRTDIARLDAENDMEEADIERLERMLDLIRRRRGAAASEPVQEDDIDDAMRDYLARGGKVQQEPARMPRLGTRLRQHGSRHIGQGREARAGQLSGRGANTNPGSNKPVVATESLRDDEYHVATVTLDDGSVKKVRMTSDEGFRDRIQKHFKKQGREVTNIDVDFSVRSKFDENKPTFTGAPARPQPQPVNPSSPMLPPAPGRPGFVNKPVQETKKKPQPTNPELWSRAKAAAKSKFDVYPSAYANAWAAKYYKSKGGGWRMGKPKKD